MTFILKSIGKGWSVIRQACDCIFLEKIIQAKIRIKRMGWSKYSKIFWNCCINPDNYGILHWDKWIRGKKLKRYVGCRIYKRKWLLYIQRKGRKEFSRSVLVLVTQLCLTLCDPMDCDPTRLLCPWNSLGKNTGVGCHSLLQGIVPSQGLNPSFLHWQKCRQILYCLRHREALINCKYLYS